MLAASTRPSWPSACSRLPARAPLGPLRASRLSWPSFSAQVSAVASFSSPFSFSACRARVDFPSDTFGPAGTHLSLSPRSRGPGRMLRCRAWSSKKSPVPPWHSPSSLSLALPSSSRPLSHAFRRDRHQLGDPLQSKWAGVSARDATRAISAAPASVVWQPELRYPGAKPLRPLVIPTAPSFSLPNGFAARQRARGRGRASAARTSRVRPGARPGPVSKSRSAAIGRRAPTG